ncbi:MAG: tRNA pseudouridine(38-40) synthase TruA [Candidatus Asgardarchaeia archaeon]
MDTSVKTMRRYALKVAYLGERFHGFQRQPHLRTVEGEILNALKESTLVEDIATSGYSYSGRTDKGVSAVGQTISFLTEKEPNLGYINSLLPDDIFFWAYTEVDLDFDPRRDALSRTYLYFYPYSDEDIDLMKEAAKNLEGLHDFRYLSKSYKKEVSTVREIKEVSVSLKDDVISFSFKAKSFLWQQVRRMVSLILMVGKGILSLEEVSEILDGKLRKNIAPAPAHGLILFDVSYPVRFKKDEKAAAKGIKVVEELLRKASVSRFVFKSILEKVLNSL